MEPIILQTKQDLDVYINPQRQNILRCMRIAAEPMTPKQISDQVGVSPSSVQHHIGRLLALGVVNLSHTEVIRGITARYYTVSPAPVQIGSLQQDEHAGQRTALLQNALASTFSGYTAYCADTTADTASGQQFGDMLYGILHLTPEEAREVYAMIGDYIQSHEHKTEGSQAWEYALIAYPVREQRR